MYHNRRKKKRVNYGVRAVELLRGSKGFGFTISGQQPCILSCIVPGSPADTAGLRAGDYLIAVNGYNVSKLPHDDVVQLIGHCKGILRLQIAENYYSDSSDEDGVTTIRSKPKYAHKPRTANASGSLHQCRVAKVVQDLQSGAMFDTVGRMPPPSKMQCDYAALQHRWNMTSPLPLPPPPTSYKRDSEKIVHRTVVGYLGTIDIPNELHPSSMMQVLRKCIKRLKAEKRNPTTVLLTIHVANIKLTNLENQIIAEYPSHRIIFCNSFSDQDKQYFGILTQSLEDTDDIVSNSCHVFTIYYKLIDHAVHSSTCNVFGFTCTKTSLLNVCQEFPESCTGLIGAIQTLYISNAAHNEANSYNEGKRHQEAVSPQPSNVSTSTAHSSNSDSGIGFKDDYNMQPEKKSAPNLPQIPNKKPRDSDNRQLAIARAAEQDKMRLLKTMKWEDETNATCSKDEGRLYYDRIKMSFGSFCPDETTGFLTKGRDRNSCPEPAASTTRIQKRPVQQGMCCNSVSVGSLASACTTAMLDGIDDTSETSENSATKPQENECNNKFSPKVDRGYSKSMVHSMENFPSMDYFTFVSPSSASANDKSRPWVSLQEIRDVDNYLHGSVESCDKIKDCKSVHKWSSGFEKLLVDNKGLQTFAQFLKKEFSHENIYFWAACERYKDNEDLNNRRKLAWQIYQRHLSNSAGEPVNVDSHATGEITQQLLNEAPSNLFLQAQKQVFNLMKFDSYPRFLRSDLYRRCLESGYSVISTEDCNLNLTSSSNNVKLKKSHSDAEDRSRKSILPWNRKNRSKSKDRGESEYNKTPSRGETIYKSFSTIKKENEGNNNEDNISISSSRSSLASWDLALRQSFNKHSMSSCEGQSNEKKELHNKCTGLCRVILPDGSTTVVPTSQTESIRDVITRLFDKRALRYSSYDVLILGTDEMIDIKNPSLVLASQEVEVVPTKVLKVDLPSRRLISVRAHKGRTLREVLRPLLKKYGFNVESISVWADGHPITLDTPAIGVPSRLVLITNDGKDFQSTKLTEDNSHQSTLDEITNKVFEELLVGKSTNKSEISEGSCKSDDRRSESSSILSSKFFLRDSTLHGKKKSKSKYSGSEKSNLTDSTTEETCSSSKHFPPLIAKWRNGVKLQLPGRFDGEDLYEDLKRAQRSRLEDQRGTEINSELPDFLKNKENGKPTNVRRPFRGGSYDGYSRFYDMDQDKTKTKSEECVLKNGQTIVPDPIESSIVSDYRGNDSFSNHDTTLIDHDQTIVERNDDYRSRKSSSSNESSPTKLFPMKPPPPLPPKPKGLIKTGYIVPSKSMKKSNQIHSAGSNVRPFQNKNFQI